MPPTTPLPARFGPLPAALAMAAGIAAVPALDEIRLAPWLGWLGLVAAIAAWRRYRAAVLAAACALGVVRGTPGPVAVPPGAIADDHIADRVVGVVHGPIAHGALGDAAVLDTGAAAIWLWTSERLVPGERIAATGFVHSPRGLRDPAVDDRGATVHARGAQLELTAHSLERLGDASGPADRLWRWADQTQARWARDIDRAGGDPAGSAALRGITVGDRGTVPAALDQRWRAAGIFHVLSVSGLHLAVVAGLAFALLRRLFAASPWGGRIRPARWAAPPAIALAIAYTLITGAEVATLRALAVVLLALVAQILDRPVRLVDALGLAALVILAWRPADLLDPSFQLSFVAALTLALRPRAVAVRRGVRGWLVRGFTSSAWVALTTAPVSAYHFHQVAAGGVVGNLVLTPIVELVALPLGLAGVVLGVPPAITAASWLVGLADRGAGALADVVPVGDVAVTGATTMAILVGLSLWIATRAGGARPRFAWLALCLMWWLARSPLPAGALRVTFLDVGQGDAALIELPDGGVWLVDAGGAPNAHDAAQAVATGRVIDRVLAGYEHRRIDLAIVSHPHPDHYLGLAGIAAPIGEVWSAEETDAGPGAKSSRPGPGDPHAPPGALAPSMAPPAAVAEVGRLQPPPLPGFDAVVAGLAARGTRLSHPPLGVVRSAAGVELEVLAPRYRPDGDAAARCATDPVRTVNDNSLVVALRYRGRTILFAGDVEAEGEDELLAAGLGAVDVVKVAHHGSPTSSTEAFVAATRPTLSVISCGAGNAFGFPSPAVVERWRAVGAEIARTDRDGAITVTIDASGALAIERFAP